MAQDSGHGSFYWSEMYSSADTEPRSRINRPRVSDAAYVSSSGTAYSLDPQFSPPGTAATGTGRYSYPSSHVLPISTSSSMVVESPPSVGSASCEGMAIAESLVANDEGLYEREVFSGQFPILPQDMVAGLDPWVPPNDDGSQASNSRHVAVEQRLLSEELLSCILDPVDARNLEQSAAASGGDDDDDDDVVFSPEEKLATFLRPLQQEERLPMMVGPTTYQQGSCRQQLVVGDIRGDIPPPPPPLPSSISFEQYQDSGTEHMPVSPEAYSVATPSPLSVALSMCASPPAPVTPLLPPTTPLLPATPVTPATPNNLPLATPITPSPTFPTEPFETDSREDEGHRVFVIRQSPSYRGEEFVRELHDVYKWIENCVRTSLMGQVGEVCARLSDDGRELYLRIPKCCVTLNDWLKAKEKSGGSEEGEADLMNCLKLDGRFDVDIHQMIESMDCDLSCDISVEMDDERVDQRVMVLKQCLSTLYAIHNHRLSLCGCFSVWIDPSTCKVYLLFDAPNLMRRTRQLKGLDGFMEMKDGRLADIQRLYELYETLGFDSNKWSKTHLSPALNYQLQEFAKCVHKKPDRGDLIPELQRMFGQRRVCKARVYSFGNEHRPVFVVCLEQESLRTALKPLGLDKRLWWKDKENCPLHEEVATPDRQLNFLSY